MKRTRNLNYPVALFSILLFAFSQPAHAGVPSPAPSPLVQTELQIANIGDFQFENGEIVKNFEVSYVTHGKCSERKDNVILAMQGSWGRLSNLNFLIGPGKALDTNKYFIIATDRLGSANMVKNITTGPTNSGLKMDFPQYSIRDEVNLEYRLLKDYLGFDHILVAIGTSLGGQKAYQFGVSYPNFARGLIPMFSSPVTNPRTRTLAKKINAIIQLDTAWHGGEYETNPIWAVHTAQWNYALWLYTSDWFAEELNTEEAYQKWQNRWKFILRNHPMDARDWFYTNLSWGTYHIGDTPGFDGNSEAALQSIQVPVLIIGSKGDMHFRPEESIFAKNAIKKSHYVQIETTRGHASCCGLDIEANEIISMEITEFLQNFDLSPE